MPVQVSPVLETTITAFVLAHETEVSLMSYPVLFQPTFKWEALASPRKQNEDFCGCTYAYPGQFGLQTFFHITRSQLLHDLPGGDC